MSEIAGPGLSTVSQKPRTKLEAFEAQTGTVVVKGFSKAGSVSGLGWGVSVECMELIDASKGTREMGIVVEVTGMTGDGEQSERSFIDHDEIDPLLKGIDYVSRITSTATKLADFEAIYATEGDFRIITFSSSGKVEAAVKSGSAAAHIPLRKLGDVSNLISKAKQTLDSIK